MPLRKLEGWERPKRCLHPEHNPPNMIVLSPGVWEHTCPGCGEKIVFTVPEKPTLFASKPGDTTGELRQVSSLSEIRSIARRSAQRLMRAFSREHPGA